ncbi:MAG: GNAT family N-acetyltransferase [Candidatus Afipia apatlaquensis]|uniref:GNAT family N-acetyltransferase n=1 Tax=Candidatus Afipia apatlaquensis TaxID=2712852 RepID=A0A7C9RJ05_9BRAD|nr:GNAT family N-acetyltransferase [Candidatus Afipia apatlaquensis]
MHIRPAVSSDALKSCNTMRRSIAELCVADHRNETVVLGRWLANKTPEVFATWLKDTGNTVLVADHDGLIAAVGAVNDDGEITCNYVSPDFRFQGVSKMMLASLEGVSLVQGNVGTTLFSTKTAHGFYRAAGYRDGGSPFFKFGTESYPMFKQLAPSSHTKPS